MSKKTETDNPAVTLTLATPGGSGPVVPEPWVNSAAACCYLGISPATLHRWIQRGRLDPHRTPTGQLRFRLTALDALLDTTKPEA